MANPLSSLKTEHPYVAGLALVTVGVLGAVGSVLGSLAAMGAALFMNSKLPDGTNHNPGLYTTSGVKGTSGYNSTSGDNSTPANSVVRSEITGATTFLPLP